MDSCQGEEDLEGGQTDARIPDEPSPLPATESTGIGAPALETFDRKRIDIEIVIPLNPQGGNIVNIAHEIAKKYGPAAMNTRAAAYHTQLQLVDAQQRETSSNTMDDMSVDLRLDAEGDKSTFEIGGMNSGTHRGADAENAKHAKQEDNLIDKSREESELMWQGGFFVYAGPLLTKSRACLHEQRSSYILRGNEVVCLECTRIQEALDSQAQSENFRLLCEVEREWKCRQSRADDEHLADSSDLVPITSTDDDSVVFEWEAPHDLADLHWIWQRVDERRGLQSADRQPWRFFHLPQKPMQSFGADARSVVVRLETPDGTDRLIVSAPPSQMHSEHLQLVLASTHTCHHCAEVCFDLRNAVQRGDYTRIAVRTRELPVAAAQVIDAARAGCTLCQLIEVEIYLHSQRDQVAPEDLKVYYNVSMSQIASRRGGAKFHFSVKRASRRDKASAGVAYCQADYRETQWHRNQRSSLRSVRRLEALELHALDGVGTYYLDGTLPPNPNPDAESTYGWIRRRMGECETAHGTCRALANHCLPKRLLNVSHASSTRLCELSGHAKYATLSYVWGVNQPHKLSRANLDSYKQGITRSRISPVVQDAIKVTQGIGLKYLWVDAYCILQDDEEDKEVEVARMYDIYRGSAITIVGAVSNSCEEGFLHPRVEFRPMKLSVRWDDNVWGSMLAVPYANHNLYSYASKAYKVFRRGWTFQETHMTPRVVLFDHRDVHFICAEGSCQQGGHAARQHPTPSGPSDHVKPGLVHFTADHPLHSATWSKVIDMYTARSLTKEEDKLPAIAGLATYYARRWGLSPRDYVAGLWRQDLLGQLAWTAIPGEQEPARPWRYVAPSWSWAPVVARVRGHAIIEPKWTLAASVVLDCRVELAGSSHFGRVMAGRLVLRGRCRAITYYVVDTRYGPEYRIRVVGERFKPGVAFDVPLGVVQATEIAVEYICVELFTFRWPDEEEGGPVNSVGLVLRQCGDHETFQRIGLLDCESPISFFDEDSEVRTFTIV